MNIHACLHDAQTLLSQILEISNHEAKLEVQLLLQQVLKVNRAWLIAHKNDALQLNNHEMFEALLNRRLSGEPMAYILGCREFYGLELMVTPDTLIPRPDTETLVEAALAKIPQSDHLKVLDLGTGTGAIALAIAKHRPQASVTAVDASSAALEITKKNAHHLNMTNVLFVLGNWFDNITNEKFDVIVSNPPYIEQNDAHLTQGDLRFEPLSALASGIDGLDDIRHIINHCLIYLKPQGWLMLEHGYNQAEQVANLMADTGLTNIEAIRDLGGNDRVTIGKNPLIVSTHWD
ncbi:MAG: peptide chain release factor N(5)-glutamine methyltransferase [Methylotenera sp.]|nr:peptide chain release factor N(5)-glutamine methyltransferase [Methylotenera sp.]